MKIQALHEFHNEDFSKGWASKFVPTPERLDLFETMLKHITVENKMAVHVLELGTGPGFLAEFILERLSGITYEGLDFARPMLDIAAKKLEKYSDRIQFVQADLIHENWTEKLNKTPDVVVTTWALHDLFSKKNIFNVYKTVSELLPDGGLFLNGDFIKPEASTYEYEGGRIKPSEHLTLFKQAKFNTMECLKEFEKNVHQPTTANNYACFKAEK